MEFAIIQADIARHFPISNRDIRIAVAVQPRLVREIGEQLRCREY
jgi:hypothetical protein